MSFVAKESKATRWWFGLLILVLVALFFETAGQQHGGCNLFINTDSDTEGADVIVDGKKVGSVAGAGSSGMGGGAFWGYLTRGEHLVELRKQGFQPFHKAIDMHGEEYLGVDLKPARN
jgi:hypothetical protein